MRLLTGFLVLCSAAAQARWAWDSSEQDERVLLETHTATVLAAYEGFKKMGKPATAPFSPEGLRESVDLLSELLRNDNKVGNEAHYEAVVTRVRDNLDDRFDRFAYEVDRLISAGRGDDLTRLQRLIDQKYFTLPLVLEVEKASDYAALKRRVEGSL
ncbi:MAG: hypothetical protein AAGG55_05060 [Pseudomonadota bacterium]